MDWDVWVALGGWFVAAAACYRWGVVRGIKLRRAQLLKDALEFQEIPDAMFDWIVAETLERLQSVGLSVGFARHSIEEPEGELAEVVPALTEANKSLENARGILIAYSEGRVGVTLGPPETTFRILLERR
jgi:hypothetical protein